MNANLITRERAQQCIAAITSASSFTNEENRVLDHDIAAVSDAIRQWCRRDFTAQLYDELYDGTGAVTLIWLGRRRIAGIEPGRAMRVEGRIGVHDDVRVMFNPRYDLRAS